jgi:beta-lactam-binding protein with PASTA domain
MRTVPDVVGLHRQQAVDVLTEAQLGVQIVRSQVRDPGQIQRVVAQQPPAGQVVPAESVVRLTVGTKRPSGDLVEP